MKGEIKRKQVLDTFSQKLNINFSTYCRKHGQDTDLDHFITYLVDQELISASAIKQYTILATFDDLYQQNEGRKTQTVQLLANRFNLTPRSIWNVLRKRKDY